MRLERLPCKPLERAKNFSVSPSYIVGCTGQKAVILDRQGTLLHTVEKLRYVYSARISPDETKLLLISNENRFYIVDMRSFAVRGVTVKVPWNQNLEGRGCWTFDGNGVLIPVSRRTDALNSTLRRYCVEDLSQYQDFLADKYVLNNIFPLKSLESYLLIGYDRQRDGRNYFIRFDGRQYREFPLDVRGSMAILGAAMDEKNGTVTVAYVGGCSQFTLEGEKIGEMFHPEPKDKTFSFAGSFSHLLAEEESRQRLKELSTSLHLENISARDYINKYALSSCGKYIHLASQSGFYLLDAATGKILAAVPETYGVQNFEELSSDTIAVATWSGVKLYRLCGQDGTCL